MRLFVAILPPAPVLDHLETAVAAARSAAPDLRWASPEHRHLTLAFLGQVDQARLPELAARLGGAASRHPGLTLAARGAGRFDGRVLWAGVAGDVEPLRALAASVAAGARRAKVDVDPKPIKPHLTLARAREGTRPDLRPLVDALAGYAGPWWRVTEIALVRSYLGLGARYETLATWPLRLAWPT